MEILSRITGLSAWLAEGMSTCDTSNSLRLNFEILIEWKEGGAMKITQTVSSCQQRAAVILRE